ncbi:MAG: RNA polymerase sigma factor [Acidobacteria bacterium]|nr:RNA polymerase sigma factor [Acidobacteriota bacterium]
MTDPQTLGEEELLRLTRAGDESVADDVTQEVFLALMGESFRFDSSRGVFASYLYGVARNQVRRHLERGRFQVPLDEDLGDEALSLDPIVAAGDPLGDLTLREGLSALRQAIWTLPLHYREVVALCDLEEMSSEEAACSIGCAVGTIRSRLHRAHALLVQKLREPVRLSRT